jgi:hypothetical protein
VHPGALDPERGEPGAQLGAQLRGEGAEARLARGDLLAVGDLAREVRVAGDALQEAIDAGQGRRPAFRPGVARPGLRPGPGGGEGGSRRISCATISSTASITKQPAV